MKFLLALLAVVGANAQADAIVSGNSISSKIYLLDEPAKRMFEILQEAKDTAREDFGDCTEIRSQNIGCSYDSHFDEYLCAISVNGNGNVENASAMLCPRP